PARTRPAPAIASPYMTAAEAAAPGVPSTGQNSGVTPRRLTPAECAERARSSVSLVYAWCRAGVLTHYRLGRPGKRGRIVIDEQDFEAFLATMKQTEPPADDDGELKWIK